MVRPPIAQLAWAPAVARRRYFGWQRALGWWVQREAARCGGSVTAAVLLRWGHWDPAASMPRPRHSPAVLLLQLLAHLQVFLLGLAGAGFLI